MANTIQIKRGLNANLPTLSAGEFGFSTDTYQVYIGDGSTNHEVIMDRAFDAQTILAATTANSPSALTISEGNIVGRKTGGNVAALGGADVMAILSGTATANFAMNSNKITGVTDPTSAQDAATKAYADSISAGVDPKDSVVAATDGTNIDLTSATDPNPIDGITLTNGDRVLLKDQTTGSEDGIYDAVTATDPTTWTRTSDADADADVTAGLYVWVEEGTANGDAGFILTTDDPITVGTTALTFTQFTGAYQITAGTDLSKSGNTLNVVESDIDLSNCDNTTSGFISDITGETFDSLSDVAAITEAQGQVIYYDGTTWNALGVGTSGQLLQTQGSAANPVWGGISSFLEATPTDEESTKAPTSNWAYDHNAAATGVHGAGANTLLHSASTIDGGSFT